MPFFLDGINNSWVRTWSKYKHNTNAWSPKVDGKIEEDNIDDGVLANARTMEMKRIGKYILSI